MELDICWTKVLQVTLNHCIVDFRLKNLSWCV